MNSSATIDPGLRLGKIVVKLAEVLFAGFAFLFFFFAYLSTTGFFREWNIRIEPEISDLLPVLSPDQILTVFCVIAGVKFLIFLGIMVLIDRDL
ncbi:MAG: hypothetical protein HWE15_02070 [Algoriphagus sp.]|uniref:hypothetical protein n=1 Tax=Algoriphagus sp. TaxID=1872435 RepID=UPI001849171A|nr:hypothetical protein [Algoriphagus sp.]NVJ85058.1 hypothetical protein [Algoriphagus sp.]